MGTNRPDGMIDVARRPPVAGLAGTPRPAPGSAPAAGGALALAALVVVATAVPAPGFRLPVVLALAFAGPGLALLATIRVRDRAVAWSLAVLTSLTAFAGTATLLVWSHRWHPWAAVWLLAAVTAAGGAARLARTPRPTLRVGPVRRPAAGHLAVVAAALGLWAYALATTDLTRVGQYGLLGSVPPAWFGALALTVGGFVASLVRLRDRVVPALYVVTLVLVLHATTPALLDAPGYATAYPDIGVVEWFQHGAAPLAGDAAQQWPAVFAAAAQFGAVTGVSAAGVAAWSVVAFNLVASLLLLAVARTLTPDHRVAYLTVFLFQCVTWVTAGQLAPLALAFLLSLGVLLIALRYLPGRPGRRPPLAVLAGVTVVYAVLVATDRLAPLLVLLQVAVLARVARRVGPWWVTLVFAAVVVAYLAPRAGLVTESFDLLARVAGDGTPWGSLGQAFSAVVVRILALATVLLAVVAALATGRRWRTVVVPVVLLVTPLALLLLDDRADGGPAVHRVFLFAAPWCAYLIALGIFRVADRTAVPVGPGAKTWHARPSARRAGVAVTVVLLFVAALVSVQGQHGQLMVDRRTPDELAAAHYVYDHGRPGATVALASSAFPARLDARYPLFDRGVTAGEPDLAIGADLHGSTLPPEVLPQVETYVTSFHGTTAYLVISDGMRRQSDYFGYFPTGTLDRLESTLDSAPGWSLFYGNPQVRIYQYAPT